MYKVRFVNFPRQYQQLKGELDRVFEEIMSGGDLFYAGIWKPLKRISLITWEQNMP